jgi:hypothetical protein
MRPLASPVMNKQHQNSGNGHLLTSPPLFTQRDKGRGQDPPQMGIGRFSVYQPGYDAAIDLLRNAFGRGEGEFDPAWA